MTKDVLFAESPFSPLADERSARCWSGRAQTRERLLSLKRALTRLTDSTLDVLWASLGAGKTHTLLYMAYLLQDEARERPQTVPIFVEMPEQLRNFLDMYKRIASALPLDSVAEIVEACPKGKAMDSLARASTVIRYGGPVERQLVADWFVGGRPSLKDLRQSSGISQRIEDDLAATDLLTGIVHAFGINRVRLVLLFDEFQRIGVLKPVTRDRILSSIRSIFSRNSSHFSMILSIQSKVEEHALKFIPPELRTLLGKNPTIPLPEMDEREAKTFLIGRFQCYRPRGFEGDPTAPFELSAVEAGLRYVHKQAGIALNPREILQAFAFVYARAEDPSKGIAAEETLRLLQEAYASSPGT